MVNDRFICWPEVLANYLQSQLKCGETDKLHRESPGHKQKAAQEYAAMFDLLLQN